MNKKNTGKLIRESRIKKGYTQIELGDLLGVSNKAVSRWENGDSFPDIGVLENLSKILELKIQDIVMGEIEESHCDTAVTEIVRIAKIQEIKKLRSNISIGIGWIVSAYLLFSGYYNLSGKMMEYRVIHFWSLAVILTFISIKCVYDKKTLNPLLNKLSKWFTGISLFSGIYIIGVIILTVWSVNHGNIPFNIKKGDVGLFLHNQLILFFVMNFIIFVIECFRVSYREEAVYLDVYISVAVIHLILIYSNLLHSISSPDIILQIFIYKSILVLIETILIIATTYFVKKLKRSYKQDE